MDQSPLVLRRFARKVRDLRERRGYSQEGLASATRLSRNYIGMIERAEANVTLLTIEKIARALNVDGFELLKG